MGKADMLGDFSASDVRKLSKSLRSSHGAADWTVPDFSPNKSEHMARVAQLAYCAISEGERKRYYRAKLMPSRTYQSLVRRRRFDFPEIVRAGEFEFVVVVRSAYFVALIIRIQSDIFIGIRGTLFAYDWGINFSATPRRGDAVDGFYRADRRLFVEFRRDYPGFLHAGFHREALILSHLIGQRLDPLLKPQPNVQPPAIHVAGHSLGGAIAAILAMRGFRRHNFDSGYPIASDTYIYGSPRIGSARAVRHAVVYATRRELDLVPHTPPRWLGYADFLLEFDTDGAPFVRPRSKIAHASRWIAHVWPPHAIRNHMLEAYISEIRRARP